MFEKLRRDIFVNVIFERELKRNAHHVQAEHSHPARAVALFEMASIGKRVVPIEHANVIEPEKSALKDVVAFRVFAIHPPGEGDEHFVKDRLEKRAIAFAGFFSLDLINAPRRPGEDGRIHVAEIPLVGGDLSVRMLVPFAHDDIELRFGEVTIDKGEWNTMEGQVPRCVPGIFPFVRHRHDAFVVKMPPLAVTALLTFGRRRWLRRIAIQPLLDDVMIKLFAPQHPGERLPLNGAVFFA